MIKNGKSYPPIPLKLSNRISIGIEFEVTPEDEISISGRVRNFAKKCYRSKTSFRVGFVGLLLLPEFCQEKQYAKTHAELRC